MPSGPSPIGAGEWSAVTMAIARARLRIASSWCGGLAGAWWAERGCACGHARVTSKPEAETDPSSPLEPPGPSGGIGATQDAPNGPAPAGVEVHEPPVEHSPETEQSPATGPDEGPGQPPANSSSAVDTPHAEPISGRGDGGPGPGVAVGASPSLLGKVQIVYVGPPTTDPTSGLDLDMDMDMELDLDAGLSLDGLER
jgi:hypothetical protein